MAGGGDLLKNVLPFFNGAKTTNVNPCWMARQKQISFFEMEKIMKLTIYAQELFSPRNWKPTSGQKMTGPEVALLFLLAINLFIGLKISMTIYFNSSCDLTLLILTNSN